MVTVSHNILINDWQLYVTIKDNVYLFIYLPPRSPIYYNYSQTLLNLMDVNMWNTCPTFTIRCLICYSAVLKINIILWSLTFKLFIDFIPKVAENYCELYLNANAMLLFAAGTETVAAIASCCLYKLAMNKDIQDKLRAETISTKTKCGGELNNAFLGILIMPKWL